MSKEIVKMDEFTVNFKPATLEIKNYEQMKELVKNYANRFNNLVIDKDDRQSLTEVRSELLGLRNKLDEERKNVKRTYNEPLNEFEDNVKGLTALIDVPLHDVREGIQRIDEQEKAEIEANLMDELDKKLEDKTVDIADVEFDDRWLNKGNWTKALQPRKKLHDEIDYAIKQAELEKERVLRDIQVLSAFCEAKGIEPDGWISQLENKTTDEIIAEINMAEEQAIKRAEAEQKAKEKLAEQSELQRKAEQANAEAEKVRLEEKAKLEAKVSSENPFEETVFTNTIEVTGTKQQLGALNTFLKNSGIKVRQVG